MLTLTEKIKSLGKNATAVPILNKSKFCEIKVSLPDLPTQRRIATILSRYDSLIENYQKQIKLLEEAAQRLYKEWFVDLHFPGHENTKIVDGVPEGWEKKSVKTIVEMQSGYAFKSSDFASDGIYKIVTIKNVKDGAFDGENVSKIASIPEKMPKHCILEDGDILLSLTGNVGRVCIVVGKNYLLNQRVAKLKSIFKAYTYCLFRSRDMFIDVNNLANGAAQQNVSPIKIGEMKILIPENKLLNEFEKESSNYISGVIAFQSQIRLLTEARDRLLPKLMNGEITV
jgi:type I restriction enzyme S subunit